MRPSTYPDMFRQEQRHFWFLGKQAFVRAAISQIPVRSSRRILDIGCGTGGTTITLGIWGTVTGVEKNKAAASFAQSRGLTVIEGNAERLPAPDSSFDLVTILDVLYHKGINEYKVLSEAYRVLKPGGHLIVTDCAVPWLWSKHDEIMDAKYRYSKIQLSQVITRAGYRLHTIRYIFSIMFPIFMLSRLYGKFFVPAKHLITVPASLNTLFVRLLTWEATLFPRFHSPIGSSLLVIAQKPS